METRLELSPLENEQSVTASYRRERRPHTLKHTAPTASKRPTSHHLHKESQSRIGLSTQEEAHRQHEEDSITGDAVVRR
ncbi:hypothetical protein N665_1334s0006, partial [Sinapis alba]